MTNGGNARTGGGAATSGGTTFQEDVARYFSTLVLGEAKADPPTGLRQGTALSSVYAELTQAVDDILVGTSEGGVLYVQAKTRLSRSRGSTSEFAKVIGQFVRQCLEGANPPGGQPRPLEKARDRLILLVGRRAPATITVELESVLNKCRPISSAARLHDLPSDLNRGERDALEVTRHHIQTSWGAAKDSAPTVIEELEILHLMYVLQLDLSADGAATVIAKNLLRDTVLADPQKAGDAWNALISICRSFAPNRTGGDIVFLREQLQAHEVALSRVPSYIEDINHLCKYRDTRIGALSRLSVVNLDGEKKKIQRAVSGALAEFVSIGDGVLIGEPGSGKSGCMHELAVGLLGSGADVLLIAADLVTARSPEALAVDLGLSRSRGLAEVLQAWSGVGAGYLLIDALDGALSRMDMQVFYETILQVREKAPRWRILASIRSYDLRVNQRVQDTFPGAPHAHFNDPRFNYVRHVHVGRLSVAELSEFSSANQVVAIALEAAPELAVLVRNIFNLNLLCMLIERDVNGRVLTSVRSQTELLGLYWCNRVDDQSRIGNLLVLAELVKQMVASRAMSVRRQDLVEALPAGLEPLGGLLQVGVLVESAPRPGADTVLSFAHNILFDYGVCRLWVDGLSDVVIEKLSEPSNHDLLLAIRPSILMAFEMLWLHHDSRAAFWERALALEKAAGMRPIGKIIAGQVAAKHFRQLSDVGALLDALSQEDAHSAQQLRLMIRAREAQQGVRPGSDRHGAEEEVQWMQLAREMAQYLDETTWDVRALLSAPGLDVSTMSPEQASAANSAAISLIDYGLKRPQSRGAVRAGLEMAAETIACDPDATVKALSGVLGEDCMRIGAHEWLRPLASRLGSIASASPQFALQLVDAIFRASGDRDDVVSMGGRILAMNTNKHDLIKLARHCVAESYPEVWKKDPIAATRILLTVLNATMAEEHPTVAEYDETCRFPFLGGTAIIQSDFSHIWGTNAHNIHDEWYQILGAFQAGLKALAVERGGRTSAKQVLEVLRDEARFAITWSAVIQAACDEPGTLGGLVGEMLTCPGFLAQVDVREAVGALLESSYDSYSNPVRLAIESAILDIPGSPSNMVEGTALRLRDWLVSRVPINLIQSGEFKELSNGLEVEASGEQVPPSSPRRTYPGPGDEHWWLRQQGVDPERPENIALVGLRDAVGAIASGTAVERLSAEVAATHLSLLQEVESAIKEGRGNGAAPLLLQELDSDIVSACSRLAASDDLGPGLPIASYVLSTLRRGAKEPASGYTGVEHDDHWTRFLASHGEAARGLMHLAGNPDMVSAEVLADVERLSSCPIADIRFQILASCHRLQRTAPELMCSLVEMTCKMEVSTKLLEHFSYNVISQLPLDAYERLEPSIRGLYHRVRHRGDSQHVAESCITLYARAVLWRRDRRASRYLRVVGRKPYSHFFESNKVIVLCRELIMFEGADSHEQNEAIRSWAFGFLTDVVRAVLSQAAVLAAKHPGRMLSEWPREDHECLMNLHQLAHSVATQVYFGSGAYDQKCDSAQGEGQVPGGLEAMKARLLSEGSELFDALCEIEFVESSYEVLQTLEFLVEADCAGVLIRVAALLQRAEQDGVQYEMMAVDLVVRILERCLADFSNLLRENGVARTALLDSLDIFVGAGWPKATSLAYRLDEVFR